MLFAMCGDSKPECTDAKLEKYEPGIVVSRSMKQLLLLLLLAPSVMLHAARPNILVIYSARRISISSRRMA
jgi:hypothetical protein